RPPLWCLCVDQNVQPTPPPAAGPMKRMPYETVWSGVPSANNGIASATDAVAVPMRSCDAPIPISRGKSSDAAAGGDANSTTARAAHRVNEDVLIVRNLGCAICKVENKQPRR